VDGDDDEYFEMIEKGELNARGLRETERQSQQDAEELGREHRYKAACRFFCVHAFAVS
jgi:ATP-dependent DNA helicase